MQYYVSFVESWSDDPDKRPTAITLWTKSIPDTLQVQKEKTKTPANPVTNESRTGMKILKWHKN